MDGDSYNGKVKRFREGRVSIDIPTIGKSMFHIDPPERMGRGRLI
jgi:hypothetical protein